MAYIPHVHLQLFLQRQDGIHLPPYTLCLQHINVNFLDSFSKVSMKCNKIIKKILVDTILDVPPKETNGVR